MYTHGPAGQSYTVDLLYAPTVLSIVSSLSNGTVLRVRTASVIATMRKWRPAVSAVRTATGLAPFLKQSSFSSNELLLPLKLNGGNYSGAR